MPFPEHIEKVLSAYGVRADTKAALYDLYVALGNDVLEVFGDIAEGANVSELLPEDTLAIRERVVERYLRRNHPQWIAGNPTASLWHPREAEGRASGAAIPLREVDRGILIVGRNAHSGGRLETISFDVVARDLEDAIAIAKAEGQQHTIPGSVGSTSGTFDSERGVALIWEIQPNVFKPQEERNREIAKIYRRHRDWHLITLAAAIEWLRAQRCAIFVLNGNALAITHEVNPAKPISEMIAALHDRTVQEVARALGLVAREITDDDELMLVDSVVMNQALRKHVLQYGGRDLIDRMESVSVREPRM